MATAQNGSSASPVGVMISYSRTNSDFATQLWSDLNAAGFPTWMDQRDLRGGEVWDATIRRAIDEAQVVLVILSPAAVQSRPVRKEYLYALRRRKVVIPLWYFPCDVPAALARLHAIEFRPSFVNPEAYYAQQFNMLTDYIAGWESLDAGSPLPAKRQRGSRALTVALGLAVIVSATAAVATGSASGALLPVTIRPYATALFDAAFVLLALSGLRLMLRLRGRMELGIHLYLADRERFLNKVSIRYTNRLKPPFEGAVLLTLGLSEDAQALAHPSLAALAAPDAEPQPLPTGTSIDEVFRDAEGQLLILGNPGAGKSTLLYQLAQSLVGQARIDKTIPMPVVLNLASWARERKALDEWMANELFETWQVPAAIALVWVEHRQILPLLDGLDEVAREIRDDCVEAINRYHHDHGLDPLVVCSRTQDYYGQQARLDLQKAAVAQPLTPDQIDAYLKAGGQHLADLRALARTDDEVRELLSTPLFLNVVALAYVGEEASTIPRPNDDRGAWTRAVFRDYVQQMLQRKGGIESNKQKSTYSPLQTTRYLAWLAREMLAHNQSAMFYVEQIQPSWLPSDRARRDWRRRVQAVFGIIAGLVVGANAVLAADRIAGLAIGVFAGLAAGTVTVFAVALGQELAASPSQSIITLASTSLRRTRRGVVYTLAFAAGAGLYFGFVTDQGGWRIETVAVGLVLGVGFGLRYLLVDEEIDARDSSSPDDGAVRSFRSAIFVTGTYTLVLLVVFVQVHVVAVVLYYAFAEGKGIPRALDFIQHFGFLSALARVMGYMSGGLVMQLIFVLDLGLAFGLAYAMQSGLGAYIKHNMLLRVLVHSHLVPSNYIGFLDFAADHILLQRVGGGYRFIHALLLDYFADQWPSLADAPQSK